MEMKRKNVGKQIVVAKALCVGSVLMGIVALSALAQAEGGATWKDGAEMYAKVCAFCHEATVGPVLRGRGLDPVYIKFMVRQGSRAMPAFRLSEIDDGTLEKVAEYVAKKEPETR